MPTSAIRYGLRLLAIAALLGIGSVPAVAADYYIRVSGSPNAIFCTNTGFTFGPGAKLQWSLASASSQVDGSVYVNGALAGGQTSSPGALSGTPSGSIDLSQVFSSGTPYAPTPFPYTLNYVLQPQEANTEGVSFSFTCTASGGTSFTSTIIPARVAMLSATPPSVNFASINPGATSAPTNVTITNSGTANAEGVVVSLNNTADFGIMTNSCGAAIPQGASCDLSLVFHPSASGNRSAKVKVDTTTGESLSVSVSGIGFAQLSIAPSVNFGKVNVGTTSTPDVVTVTNSSATPVTVSSVTSGNPAEFPVTTTCVTVAPGATCTIAISFAPAAAGVRNSAVTVVSDGIGSPQTIVVNGTGSAAAGPGQLSMPGSVVFGAQMVGTTSAASNVLVTNIGGTAVTISGIASSAPAEFVVSAPGCTTLAAGAACTISISFTPAAVGARSATITVTGSGVGSPQTIAASGTGTTAPSQGMLSMPGTISFGTLPAGTPSAVVVVTMSNVGGTSVTVSGVTSSASAEFAVDANCGVLNPGAPCVFNITFTPAAVGARAATVTVTSNGVGSPQTIAVTGTALSVAAPGQLAISQTIDFGSVMVGTTGAPSEVYLSNIGGSPVSVANIGNTNPAEFTYLSSTCVTILDPGASCAFGVSFSPGATGARSATLTITSDGVGSPQMVALTGTGTSTPPPPTGTVDVIEYYHAEWDHYFVTGIADEIAKLDAGVFKGWARTSYKFKAYPPNTAGSANVCRFFSTSFGERSSHFYTPFVGECAKVKGNPDWMLESEQVFAIPIPDADGVCPAGTMAVYRYYNDGQGGAPNHRYTIETSLRDDMITVRGWIPEGYGPLGVIMCAPI